MYRRGRRVATLLIITLLLLLFLVPRAYLRRTGELVAWHSARARADAAAGKSAADALTALAAAYDARAPVLKLFLSHTAVDAPAAAIAAALPLTEREALLSALNTVDAAVAHLLSIESFCAENLL